MIFCVIDWVALSLFIQKFEESNYNAPYFTRYVVNSSYLLMIIPWFFMKCLFDSKYNKSLNKSSFASYSNGNNAFTNVESNIHSITHSYDHSHTHDHDHHHHVHDHSPMQSYSYNGSSNNDHNNVSIYDNDIDKNSRSDWELVKILFIPMILLSFLGVTSGYTFYWCLQYITAGTANTIYQSECIYVFIFSAIFLDETVTWQKCIAIFVCLSGVAFISYSEDTTGDNSSSSSSDDDDIVNININFVDINTDINNINSDVDSINTSSDSTDSEFDNITDVVFGLILVMFSTIAFSILETSVNYYSKKYFRSNRKIQDTLLFQALMGFETLIFWWIIICILDILGIEQFTLPKQFQNEWDGIIVTAAMDLVYQAAYFVGISLLSVFLMAMSSLLVIPLSYIGGILFHDDSVPNFEAILGTILIFGGFILLQSQLDIYALRWCQYAPHSKCDKNEINNKKKNYQNKATYEIIEEMMNTSHTTPVATMRKNYNFLGYNQYNEYPSHSDGNNYFENSNGNNSASGSGGNGNGNGNGSRNGKDGRDDASSMVTIPLSVLSQVQKEYDSAKHYRHY